MQRPLTPLGGEGIVKSPTLEGQGMGVRAGHVAVELGEVYLEPISAPGKDTSQGYTG